MSSVREVPSTSRAKPPNRDTETVFALSDTGDCFKAHTT